MAKAPGLGERKCPQCKEVIKADAAICKHCHMQFTPDEVATATAVAAKRRKWTLIGCLSPVLLIGSCVAIITATHEEPTSVKASSPDVADVHSYADTKHAEVKVDLAHMASASDVPVAAAIILEGAGKVIKAGATDVRPDVETVTFWFTAPLVDPYGEESRSKVLQFTVKTADLRLIDYSKVPAQGLLELVDDLGFGGPAGRGAAEEYCEKNSTANRVFCLKVAR